jgi:hypothetical protein
LPVNVTAPNPLPVSGTVAVSGPVDVNVQAQALTVTQPVKVVTADNDPNQLSGGTIGTNTLLGVGPYVITDVFPANNGGNVQVQIGMGATCAALTTTSFSFNWGGGGNNPPPFHGRLLVPTGSIACATTSSGGAFWSGFKPY